MRSFHIPRDGLVPFLDGLSKNLELIAPVMAEGEPVFVTWSGEKLALDGENPLASPVEFFLPQKEVLFRYVQYSGRYTFEEDEPRPRMIFGMRPCDLKAIEVLDRIFGSDHLYVDRRRSTVIAVLNCTTPGEGCFCAQLGTGPGSEEGYDLLFTEVENGYLVEPGSPAGTLVLRDYADLFTEARPHHLAEKTKRMNMAEEAVRRSGPQISVPLIEEAIEKAPWEEIGERCLRCGGCSFVCPVCHCFNVVDRGVPDGERLRCQDSCIFSGFARMANDINPRMSQGERLRNWYKNKFVYLPERTGLVGCVGCGRCSRVCLGPIGRKGLLREVGI